MDWQARLSEILDRGWAQTFLVPGLAAGVLALFSAWRERQRKRRRNPDAVPLVPWLGLTFWSSFAALLLLGAALRGWLSGD